MRKVVSTRHVLAVNDVKASAAYYIDILGFKRDLTADGWEFLSFGDFNVMLGECPDEVPASETNNHSYFAHVIVEDADAVFGEYKANGATFTQEISDKPWGLREFGVITPDGHRFMIAHEL